MVIVPVDAEWKNAVASVMPSVVLWSSEVIIVRYAGGPLAFAVGFPVLVAV